MEYEDKQLGRLSAYGMSEHEIQLELEDLFDESEADFLKVADWNIRSYVEMVDPNYGPKYQDEYNIEISFKVLYPFSVEDGANLASHLKSRGLFVARGLRIIVVEIWHPKANKGYPFRVDAEFDTRFAQLSLPNWGKGLALHGNQEFLAAIRKLECPHRVRPLMTGGTAVYFTTEEDATLFALSL